MSWLWGGSGEGAKPAGDTAAAKMELTKTERATCYDARDAFYACARAAGKDAVESKCAAFRQAYESSCPQAWVRHFDKKQVYTAYKQKLNEAGFKDNLKFNAPGAK